MARYIDADALIKSAESKRLVIDTAKTTVAEALRIQGKAIREAIENAPTAYVAEVVRCSECKYKDDCARQMVHTTRDYVLEQNISTYNKVDFCSCGERRTDDD